MAAGRVVALVLWPMGISHERVFSGGETSTKAEFGVASCGKFRFGRDL